MAASARGMTGLHGITVGMTSYQKLAVSLPSRVAERARRAVREGRAPSLSAYVAEALDEKSTVDELASLLDAMLVETGGPLTVAEQRAADRALGVTPKPRRRSPRRAR